MSANNNPEHPVTERVERCGRCRYWGGEAYGMDAVFRSGPACKRYAPRAGAEPAWRRAEDWCGEFEARS